MSTDATSTPREAVKAAEAETPPAPPSRSRLSEGHLVFAAMLLDATVLFCAFLGAHWLRFGSRFFQGTPEVLRSEHLTTLCMLLPLWILLHGLNGLYRSRVLGSVLDQSVGVIKAVFMGCLLVLALGFVTRTDYFFEKRLVLGFAGLFATVSGLVGRLALIRPLYARFIAGAARATRIVIVGAGVEGARFLRRIRETAGLGYEVAAYVDDDPAKRGTSVDGIPVEGSVENLIEVVREVRADQVFVAIPSLGQEGTLEMMSRCMKAQVPVRLVNDILHMIASDTHVETIDGVPTYDITTAGGVRLGLLMKRVFDVAVSGTLLFMFFPLLLFISLLIRIFSPGPVLFRQVRAGQNATEFTLFKFRTMKLETDDSIHREYATNFISGKKLDFKPDRGTGEVFKMTTDPRVTPVGALLRRTSLDELPQLINVLIGDMSLVGPRPPIFYELNHYKEWHKKRLKAKPGLTGLWQVSGRSSVPFDEMVLLDLYYIDHWSLKTDLEILFRTVPVVLFGDGAY
ncbi:MAG: sugar transferase [Gemmatimonadota bacterium]|jgi:exopolysaccharide biosynthesis polyprenyl glycosylphosphotransferase|nr:sugar transferase [Gemmatimonadota bacterium]MDP6801943.1 sugar transferase [Gemmatimonadota bacterium]MDP7032364.1 sugar transferase [Gemmatimonadota bacterium]